MLEELYPGFLDMGYSPSFFWECSFQEVMDLFESFARREERRRKEEKEKETVRFRNRAFSLQILAIQTAEAIAKTLFPDKAPDMRTVKDFYPELFGKAESPEEKQLRERNEKMRQYAAQHNARWRMAHGKGGEE